MLLCFHRKNMRATTKTSKKSFAFILFLAAICFANAQSGGLQNGPFPMETPVYKNDGTNDWIEGNVVDFDSSTNMYEIMWSDMSIEEVDDETTASYVGNEQSFDDFQLVQEEDKEGLMEGFMVEQDEEESLISGEEDSFGDTSTMEDDKGDTDEGDNFSDEPEDDNIGSLEEAPENENTSDTRMFLYFVAGTFGAVVLVAVGLFYKKQRLEALSLPEGANGKPETGFSQTRLSLQFNNSGTGKNLHDDNL